MHRLANDSFRYVPHPYQASVKHLGEEGAVSDIYISIQAVDAMSANFCWFVLHPVALVRVPFYVTLQWESTWCCYRVMFS